MRHIIDQILNKQHLQAKDAIYEALAEIKTAKLQEVKKAIAATFSEASYGGSRNSFTRKNPVRADPDEMMKHIKARQEREDAERAEKKKRFLAAKAKGFEKDLKEGRLKDAAIEYEEKFGKKPERTSDLGKLRKDKAANIAKADAKKKLNEVSKGLLKRYIEKSKKSEAKHMKKVDPDDDNSMSTKNPHYTKMVNRQAGQWVAKTKLYDKSKTQKEETIQEVSKALVNRYKAKADDQVDRARFVGNKEKVMKRTMGIGKANQKLNADGKAKVKATD